MVHSRSCARGTGQRQCAYSNLAKRLYIDSLPKSRGYSYICTCVDAYAGILFHWSFLFLGARKRILVNSKKSFYTVEIQLNSRRRADSTFNVRRYGHICYQHGLEWLYHIPSLSTSMRRNSGKESLAKKEIKEIRIEFLSTLER